MFMQMPGYTDIITQNVSTYERGLYRKLDQKQRKLIDKEANV